MIGGDDLSTLTGKVSEKKHATVFFFCLLVFCFFECATSIESLQEKMEKLS